PIAVTISHEAAPTVAVTSTAAVTDQPVVANGGYAYSAVEFRQFGPQTLAVFSDPAGTESPGDYSATINWGDGTTSPGSIVANAAGSTFSVQGSHIFTQTGSFEVGVTIHHDTAANVTVQDMLTVSLPPLTLTTQPLIWKEWTPLEAPDNALATISFVDSNTQVMINWGDGTSSQGVVTQFISGGAGAALGTHTWTETGSYTVTVTVTDGASQATATLPVTVLKPVLPVPDPATASANDYYVAEMYEDILHRFVDGQGLLFWSNLLDAGAPLSVVSSALLSSDEYLTNFVIRPAYEKYLGRDADPGGITYWLARMHAGLTDEGLAASLASSAEFYINAGNTNVGYVDALYRLVLGRPADGGGESYWVGQLAAGESAFDVAIGFATSSEDRTTQIDHTYEALLGRNPSLAELDQWLVDFQSGLTTNESLIASIAATDEYYSRAVNE
ncbi:MAG TPA: DUF4214 domain-containing protein, partial [Pirellulales bacterium]|nr:DUF4214 domain-containing protein [Pirellulales bacterium]